MSAGTSSPPRNFCERLPALCILSSFIDEHEQWIDSLLQQLGWQKQSLSTKVMNHTHRLVSRVATPPFFPLLRNGVWLRARDNMQKVDMYFRKELVVLWPELSALYDAPHLTLVLQAIPFAERGKVWSCCNYRVVAEEHNCRPLRLGNKMLISAKHMT